MKKILKMEGGEDNKPWQVNCSVVAMDTTSFCYRACSVCERTLPETGGFDDPRCVSCYAINPSTSRPKRFYRILLSIATESKVMVVICFDKAARVLFGCSADELFEFAKVDPFAVATAGRVLEGEMVRMTLSKPKGGAQHVRAVSIIPLRTGFRPVIQNLSHRFLPCCRHLLCPLPPKAS